MNARLLHTFAFCAIFLVAHGAATAEPAGSGTIPICGLQSPNRCIHLPVAPGDEEEVEYRRAAGEPDWSGERILGIALSGGGSKAAPFAMGVLAGLHDAGLLLPRASAGNSNGPVDVVISSVSGGGYAAYHLFAQLARNHSSASPKAVLDQAYEDCVTVPEFAAPRLKKALEEARIGCDRRRRSPPPRWPLEAEQTKLRCAQDILQPGVCNFESQSQDAWSAGANVGLMLVPTMLSIPAHNFFNTLFDAGVSLSPSQLIYRTGIGVTYGSVAEQDAARGPSANRYLLNCPDDAGRYDVSAAPEWPWQRQLAPRVRSCRTVVVPRDAPTQFLSDARETAFLLPEPLTFQELGSLRPAGTAPSAPFWIIQATAPKQRSFFGWTTGDSRQIAADTFEFTPLGFGSLRYGFVSGPVQDMTALDAAVSAAAFFDENQQAHNNGTTKTLLGLVQHVFNVSWGTDIPNYNVSEGRRTVHRLLPFPFYFLDSPIATAGTDEREHDRRRSSFIRVIDGGNADNTGIYSLVRRGVRTIVYADASQDTHGDFQDLCLLQRELRSRPIGAQGPLYLHIPGLGKFDEQCNLDANKRSWDLFAEWQHDVPALLGCISRDKNECEPHDIAARLIIIKPRVEWNLRNHSSGFERSIQWTQDPSTKVYAAGRCVSHAHLYLDNKACNSSPLAQGDPLRAACLEALPCDVVSLYLEDANPPLVDRSAGFPQTTTVFTTLNSSGEYFASSRELARYYTHLAERAIVDALDGGQANVFAGLLQQQERRCVPPKGSAWPCRSAAADAATDNVQQTSAAGDTQKR
jgi:hypothetical protein